MQEVFDHLQRLNVETRRSVAGNFRPDPQQKEFLLDLVKKLLEMFNFYQSHGSVHEPGWICFEQEKVSDAVKGIGAMAYKFGGMGAMYYVVDRFNSILVHTTGVFHHPAVAEIDRLWNGIGNTFGKPIRDYWWP